MEKVERYLDKNGVIEIQDGVVFYKDKPMTQKSNEIILGKWEMVDELEMMKKLHHKFTNLNGEGIENRFSSISQKMGMGLFVGMIHKLEIYIEFLEDELYGIETSHYNCSEGFSKEEDIA